MVDLRLDSVKVVLLFRDPTGNGVQIPGFFGRETVLRIQPSDTTSALQNVLGEDVLFAPLCELGPRRMWSQTIVVKRLR